jgi:hypothetical protein
MGQTAQTEQGKCRQWQILTDFKNGIKGTLSRDKRVSINHEGNEVGLLFSSFS